MINTDKLRKRINDKIAENEAKAGERVDEWAAYVAEHKTEWSKVWGDSWLTASQQIQKKIKNGEVIVEGDIPPYGNHRKQDRFYSEPYRFTDGRDKPREAQVPTEVTQLLDAIDLLGEIEISHTALAKMGCSHQVMTAVSRYLAGR